MWCSCNVTYYWLSVIVLVSGMAIVVWLLWALSECNACRCQDFWCRLRNDFIWWHVHIWMQGWCVGCHCFHFGGNCFLLLKSQVSEWCIPFQVRLLYRMRYIYFRENMFMQYCIGSELMWNLWLSLHYNRRMLVFTDWVFPFGVVYWFESDLFDHCR